MRKSLEILQSQYLVIPLLTDIKTIPTVFQILSQLLRGVHDYWPLTQGVKAQRIYYTIEWLFWMSCLISSES